MPDTSLDLTYFFEGTLRREEVASAYLATLLRFDPAVRREFLRAALGADDFEDAGDWRVTVEEGSVEILIDEEADGSLIVDVEEASDASLDVTVQQSAAPNETQVHVAIDSPTTHISDAPEDAAVPRPSAFLGGRADVVMESDAMLVIVENKLGRGAVQRGQLLRYYENGVDARPLKRIVAVVIAPSGVGVDEVTLVAASPKFRVGDHVRHLSWQTDVGGLLDRAQADDWFSRTGLEAIKRTIQRRVESGATAKYPLIGQRIPIRNAIDDARNVLAVQNEGMRFGRWVGRTSETLWIDDFPASIWVQALFSVLPGSDNEPTNVVDGDQMRLTLNTRFALSDAIPRSSEIAMHWRRLAQSPSAEVPGIGVFVRSGKWFEARQIWKGPTAEAAAHLAEVEQRMIDFVTPYFQAAD